MNKYKVTVDHHDSWSASDNYTEYKFFDTEAEAKERVNFKMSGRQGKRAPEHYENWYYGGPVEV